MNHEISEYLPDILPDISSFDWRSQLTQGLAAKVSLLGDDETSKKDTSASCWDPLTYLGGYMAT